MSDDVPNIHSAGVTQHLQIREVNFRIPVTKAPLHSTVCREPRATKFVKQLARRGLLNLHQVEEVHIGNSIAEVCLGREGHLVKL